MNANASLPAQTRMTRVYVQCDNDVVKSVSLYGEGSRHATLRHDCVSGFRSVMSAIGQTSPSGADGRLPHSPIHRWCGSSGIRQRQVRIISQTDRNTGIVRHRHVRQHVSGQGVQAERSGDQQAGFNPWTQKKTGAPTPDFLVFRLNWSSPDLDRIVAKR